MATSFVALRVVTLDCVRVRSTILRAAGGVIAAASLVACGAGASTAADKECPPVDAADLTEITVARADLLLGLSEADAERCAGELGWAYRVGMRDGEYFALTEDFSLQRVTVEVENDRVVRIAVG